MGSSTPFPWRLEFFDGLTLGSTLPLSALFIPPRLPTIQCANHVT